MHTSLYRSKMVKTATNLQIIGELDEIMDKRKQKLSIDDDL